MLTLATIGLRGQQKIDGLCLGRIHKEVLNTNAFLPHGCFHPGMISKSNDPNLPALHYSCNLPPALDEAEHLLIDVQYITDLGDFRE